MRIDEKPLYVLKARKARVEAESSTAARECRRRPTSNRALLSRSLSTRVLFRVTRDHPMSQRSRSGDVLFLERPRRSDVACPGQVPRRRSAAVLDKGRAPQDSPPAAPRLPPGRQRHRKARGPHRRGLQRREPKVPDGWRGARPKAPAGVDDDRPRPGPRGRRGRGGRSHRGQGRGQGGRLLGHLRRQGRGPRRQARSDVEEEEARAYRGRVRGHLGGPPRGGPGAHLPVRARQGPDGRRVQGHGPGRRRLRARVRPRGPPPARDSSRPT